MAAARLQSGSVSSQRHDELVGRVRESVATIRSERTARIRFQANFAGFGLSSVSDALGDKQPRTAGLLRATGGIAQRAMSALPVSTLPGPDGRIDFDNERCIYSVGSFWRFYAPGHKYIGGPGEWEDEEFSVLTDEDPFWLLALLTGAIEVSEQAAESVLGVRCDAYRGFADFERARAAASRPMALPLHARFPPFRAEPIDPSRLPFEVWLDRSGRIHRAILHVGGESLTQIELFGFGEPDPIALPLPDEVRSEEDAPNA